MATMTKKRSSHFWW